MKCLNVVDRCNLKQLKSSVRISCQLLLFALAERQAEKLLLFVFEKSFGNARSMFKSATYCVQSENNYYPIEAIV